MTLTPREYEVARLYAEGWTWDSIARELHISKTTLWHHRMNAMTKADVGSMPELLTALGWLRVPQMRASASDAADLFHPPAEEGSPVVRGFGQCIAMTRRPQ